MTFDRLWSDLAPVGRDASTGGYRRFAWSRADAELREWFADQALARGLDLVTDRAGNQWAWTPATSFDTGLSGRCAAVLGGAPRLASGAGHDAGVLAQAGIATAMLFVRNPTGVSHSPAEHADRDDCLRGVDALTAVVTDLAGGRPG